MYWKWINRTQLRACSISAAIIRVFIVDSNVAWREAIETLLNCQPDIMVVGSSSRLGSAIPLIQRLQPDVVLIDSLPSSDKELVTYNQLRRMIPNIFFVLHTHCHRQVTMKDIVGEGMVGSVPKGSSPANIIRAVREACHDPLEI